MNLRLKEHTMRQCCVVIPFLFHINSCSVTDRGYAGDSANCILEAWEEFWVVPNMVRKGCVSSGELDVFCVERW
jgi:hypothetical protein